MTFFQHPSRRQNRLLLATKLNKQAARPIWDFEVGLGHLWPTPSPTPASPLLTPFHQQNLPSGSLYDLAWALRLTSSKIRLDSSPCHSSDPSNKRSTGYRFRKLTRTRQTTRFSDPGFSFVISTTLISSASALDWATTDWVRV